MNISYPYDEIKGVKMSNLAPLHIAIQCGNFDMVKTLVKNGADVNLIASFKMRPLHLAVKARNLQIIEYLIENNADINAKDINLLLLFNQILLSIMQQNLVCSQLSNYW